METDWEWPTHFGVGSCNSVDAHDPPRIKALWNAKSISKSAARVYDQRLRPSRPVGFGRW